MGEKPAWQNNRDHYNRHSTDSSRQDDFFKNFYKWRMMNLGIITAAGKGIRLKSDINKQFLNLCGKPILAHTIGVFQRAALIDEIYVLVPQEFVEYTQKNIVKKYGFTKVTRISIGGETRQETVGN